MLMDRVSVWLVTANLKTTLPLFEHFLTAYSVQRSIDRRTDCKLLAAHPPHPLLPFTLPPFPLSLLLFHLIPNAKPPRRRTSMSMAYHTGQMYNMCDFCTSTSHLVQDPALSLGILHSP